MITIMTVPHSHQRYDTVGDWQKRGPHLTITVSALGDWRKEALVAIHELVEALLCEHAGVSQEAVDQWDMNFAGDGEPGAADGCPYREQHDRATIIEEAVAMWLGVDWDEYEAAVAALTIEETRQCKTSE